MYFQFVMNLKAGSTLLDIGCGNGKYLGHNKLIYEVIEMILF